MQRSDLESYLNFWVSAVKTWKRNLLTSYVMLAFSVLWFMFGGWQLGAHAWFAGAIVVLGGLVMYWLAWYLRDSALRGLNNSKEKVAEFEKRLKVLNN